MKTKVGHPLVEYGNGLRDSVRVKGRSPNVGNAGDLALSVKAGTFLPELYDSLNKIRIIMGT